MPALTDKQKASIEKNRKAKNASLDAQRATGRSGVVTRGYTGGQGKGASPKPAKGPTDIRPLAAAASGLRGINPAAAAKLREELRKRMAPGYKAAKGGTVKRK